MGPWWQVLAPVVVLASGAVAVLLVDAGWGLRQQRRGGRATLRPLLVDALTLLTLVVALGAVVWSVVRSAGSVPVAPWATLCQHAPEGLRVSDDGTGRVLPAGQVCSYVIAPWTVALQVVALLGGLAAVLLSMTLVVRRHDVVRERVLVLIAVTGAVVVAGSRDFITLMVAVETVTIPLVALVAMRRDAFAVAGAVGLLTSALVSLGLWSVGLGAVVLASGSTQADVIVARSAAGQVDSMLLMVGVALMIGGLAYKVAAVPFHRWVADAYSGAPVPVVVALTTVSKASGVAALLVVLLSAASVSSGWRPAVAVLAVASMTVGNLMAWRRATAIGLMAASGVAQAGWVLLPLAGLPAADAARAASGYLVAYVVASVAVLSVVAVVADRHPDGIRHRLTAYRGWARLRPWWALGWGFALLCLAGLPPGVMGVVAKVTALRPVVAAGWWLVVAAALANLVLGLVVYLRWLMLAVQPPEGVGVQSPSAVTSCWQTHPMATLVFAFAALACVVFSVFPDVIASR